MPDGLDRSTIWPYSDGEPGEFAYSRLGHPVGAAAERALGDLESGRALLFSSGSAAVTAVVLALLEPSRTIALAEGAYYGTGVLFAELGRWGLRHIEYDQTGAPPEGADLVWTEAPSNPFLTMPDLHAASAHPGLLVVDSTAATPVYLRPLEHGANVVVHSATKFLGGHHDLLLGAVIVADEGLHARLKQFRDRTGATASPDDAWLLLRSLQTLQLRMERHTASARELAARLAEHAKVERVRYPGFGGLLSFDVRGDARTVERSVRRIVNATSLGGATSTIEIRHRWEGDRVPPNLLRLSVGLEDVEELAEDLLEALAAA